MLRFWRERCLRAFVFKDRRYCEQVVFLLRYVTTNEELVEKAFSAIFDWVQESRKCFGGCFRPLAAVTTPSTRLIDSPVSRRIGGVQDAQSGDHSDGSKQEK